MDIQEKSKYEEIIKAITELRYYLGEEVFTVAESTLDENFRSIIQIDKVFKNMSNLASEISALVFESKAKEKIDAQEQANIDKISLMARKIANMEFKLTQIKKKREEWQVIITDLNTMGMEFADNLYDMQTYTREIITSFRDLGYTVPKSDLANLMDLSN